jgi:serine phosphatase RsbU (regulator of sigma subunit)
MQQRPEREPALTPHERTLCSVRAVIARTADALWQADRSGAVTAITLCRPALPENDGELDDAEVAQVEQLWSKAVRCAERFSAVYHVRTPGGTALRNFLVQAVPVFDERDEVLYWSGHATEVDRFADVGTRFISEAVAVLSSSLNRATIVNRLIEASVDLFCDLCAIHTFDDDGSKRLEGVADRRPGVNLRPEALSYAVSEALRSRQPLMLLAAMREPVDERFAELVRSSKIRSLIVVPLVIGASCIGTVTFAESDRRASFAARELDVAVVVARQLALALENIKTFEREQHITERFRFLAKITERLFTSLDPARTLALLLDGITERFADYAIAAALTDGRLQVVAESGSTAGFREESEAAVIAALLERRSILNGPLHKSGPLAQTPRPLSWMMAPLFSGDTVYGALVCCSNSHHYDTTDLELLEEIGRRASLALDHAESFERERRLIQTLQEATLPAQLAPVEGASISAIYRPASSEVQVGGDWYDAYDLDDRRVLLSVGDVTGHGLEASIVMGKLRHAINVVAMFERNPARILDAVERVLLRRYPATVATAFVAVFDARSRSIAYANAGHPYPLLRRRDGTIEELEAEGLPLGLRSSGGPEKPVTTSVDDAALLLFYTDGLTEATRDTLAGERLLREAVASEAILFAESPAQFVERYCLREHSPDDVAILALNFVTSQRWSFEARDWHAARAARRAFAHELEARAGSQSDLRSAELIFGELIGTLAPHAAGRLDVALEWRTADAVLHVIERGTSRPAAQDAHGLWLVGRLGAHVTVEPLPGFGAHVQAVLPVTPGNTPAREQ